MLICYIDHNFNAASLDAIAYANGIIAEYRSQGFMLTLRQLYYQHVARGKIENSERSYKNLGNLITRGREAGLISWEGIEDRNRSVSRWLIEEDEAAVLDGIEHGFAVDFWKRQDTYVEVWVEKDALVGVIERPCRRLRVPYMACKGYLSASEAWRAGQRFSDAADDGKQCVMVHLGDHDPSGIDMTRDNAKRLELFSGAPVEVRRIALNMDQVDAYSPPPNPTKVSDSRADDYIARFGRTSWELDALEPRVIDQLVDAEVRKFIDDGAWEECRALERDGRRHLAALGAHWSDVRDFLSAEGLVEE